MTSVVTHYQLDADPASDRLEFLLCDLFARHVALRRVLPALRETGYFSGTIVSPNSDIPFNGEVRHHDNHFQFSFKPARPLSAHDTATGDEHVQQLMLRTGAIAVRTPLMHYVPMCANARRYGTPLTPRSDNAEQLRIEIPDNESNRALLPQFLRLLSGTDDTPAPVDTRPWSVAASRCVEQTVDSLTGTNHVYLTASSPLHEWARASLHPFVQHYFQNACIYHTAHPLDDGAWVEPLETATSDTTQEVSP